MSERPEPSAVIDEPRNDVSHTGGNRQLRRIFKVLLVGALVLYFGAAFVILLLRYAVLPDIGLLRPRIESELSAALHATVHIGKISARWSGLQPGVDIEQLTIVDAHGVQALSIPHANAQIAWISIPRLQLVLARLVVDAPDVLIERDASGGLSIAGVRLAFTGRHDRAFPNWLLSQRAIVLRGGTLRWRDAMRSAPELILRDIRFALLNDGRTHQIGLQAQPDGSVLHGPLDFRADFRSAAFGQAGDASSWIGTAYATAGPLDLRIASHYMALPITVDAGSVAGRVWLDFSGGRLNQARGALSGHTLALQLTKGRPALSLPAAELHYNLAQDDDGATLNIRDLVLEFGGEPPLFDGTPVLRRLDIERLSAAYQGPNIGRPGLRAASGASATAARKAIAAHGERFSIDGDAMDVGLLADIARTLPLPDAAADTLARFEPRGVLHDYAIAFARPAPSSLQGEQAQRNNKVQAIERIRFKASFDGLGFSAQQPKPGLTLRHHPRSGLPGFNNLSGSIDADEGRGTLELDARDAAVTIRGMFDEPELDFDTLAGRTTWSIENTADPNQPAIDVKIERLAFSNPDAAGFLTASYHKAGPGRGALDLKAGFDRLTVNRVPRYLPTSIDAKLRGYLAHALLAGTGHHTTIEVRGSLDEFPYQLPTQHGLFKIVAPFKGGRFDPSPWPAKRTRFGKLENWPAFDDIDGRLLIENKLLRFDIDAARYRSVKVDRVRGEITDLADRASPLVIGGTARGPLADMVQYLNDSPVPDAVNRATAQIKASGDSHLAMTITVPRGLHHPQTSAKGRVTFAGNELTYSVLPPVSNLHGAIDFTGHSVQMAGVTGQWLGGGVHGSGGLRADGSLAIDLSGRIAVDHARSLSATPATSALFEYLSGSAPYKLSVRGAPRTIPDLTLDSDLIGLGSTLPAPFNKAAGTSMPVRATVHRLASAGDERDAPAGSDLATRLKARVSQLELHAGPLSANYLVGGGLDPVALRGAIGVNKPAPLPAEGVVAALDLDTLDIDAWRIVIDKLVHPTGSAAPAGLPAAAVPATLAQSSMPATASLTVPPIKPSTVPPTAPLTMPSTTPALSLASTSPADASTSQAANASLSLTPTVDSRTARPAGAVAGAVLGVRGVVPPDVGPVATTTSSFMPTRLAAHVNHLTLLKRHWENVVLGATHDQELWQANLASDQISGHINWRAPDQGNRGELQARLAKLEIPRATEHDVVGRIIERQSTGFPAVDLEVDNLIVYGKSLGHLDVHARNTDIDNEPVWLLDKLELDNPAAKLTVNGNWRTSRRERVLAPGEDFDDDNGESLRPRRTVLEFKVDVLDAGALLSTLGLPRTIENGKGTLSGKIGWRSGPTSINYPTLNGKVSAELKEGTLVKVDPGVAKLLGLLSLQTLMRVLTLNFGDVVGHGLAFDSITGTGTIHNGVTSTDDFELVTDPARATMSGTINLVDQQQALFVKVIPTLNFGTAAIAVAFVNPLIGLGGFVGQYLLSESISNTFSREYSVTGTWHKPTIRQIKSDEGKMNRPATEHSDSDQ
ncbi:YhdP family protein [Pararobbsia alpina]|uniref:YhdP central domain-containing protein n=1 Tax=Pararobbsia alpina TaxID=621374 RepID=A0A6S7B3N7_9BURK|nr:AsmA-like C-terminal region-containing protein [Pararobbsia alpina]CAB3777034.1 hypothetical protein LMG28138_00275 [Pararobbsia alpina]